MTFALPQIEGKYEILHKIREGGMGAIYKVRHRLLGDIRVIKVIRPKLAEDEDLRARFEREARTAIRLRHPNIAQLYDFAADDQGTAYMVMEFIDGITLQEMLAKYGISSVGLAVETARQILDALVYLHWRGFIHRDIAPDNLMLTRNYDGAPLVKLIDLGIAKHLGGEADLTATGVFLGKVRYASPEQFGGPDGKAEVGPPSDLYSFGLLFFELLTGRFPIAGRSPSELIAGHLYRPPLDFAQADPDGRVPEELRQLVLRTLHKKASQRLASAEELHGLLEPFRQQGPLNEELDEILELSTRVIAEIKGAARPGSTQGKVDAQFGIETTPSPSERKPLVAEETVPAAESTEARAAALLANAQLLARLELLDRAHHELRSLLEIDPDNTQGRELLAWIEGTRELQTRDAAEPEATIAEVVADEPAAEAGPEPVPEAPTEVTGSPPPPRLVSPPAGRREAPAAGTVVGRWLAAVAAVLVTAALLGLMAWWVLSAIRSAPGTPVAATTGALVINALPWAQVVSIADREGQPVPLGEDAYTPLWLDLPPGEYHLRLAHPEKGEPVEVVVQVEGGRVEEVLIELDRVDPDAYFRQLGW